MDYIEKVMKGILLDSKKHRIPERGDRPEPRVYICVKCKKEKVTDHHWLCNKCWKQKAMKGGNKNGRNI